MFKLKNGFIPDAFQSTFNMISHDYFTNGMFVQF